MMAQEPSLEEEVLSEGRVRLLSIKRCSEIEDNFSSLAFNIQGTTIHLSAKGYLYQRLDRCFIGIESIPNKFN